MRVMKFGGSSIQDGERIKTVVTIVLSVAGKKALAVVLSALRGVTDKLIACAVEAEKGHSTYHDHVRELAVRHLAAVQELFAATAKASGGDGESVGTATIAGMRDYRGPGAATFAKLLGLLDELEQVLTGIELVRECSPRSLDLVMSFGERLSCLLATDYIQSLGQPAVYVDAREIVRTDDSHGRALVNFADSYARIRERLASVSGIPIITGFIASAPDGATTTLGRNGSDYTASIIGAAVNAEAVEIWTDVDGVMSADPRFVKDAFVLPQLSYQEAMELSYFGAKVIHPNTMIPAVEKDIPILIKNTLNPAAPGTLISHAPRNTTMPITGIASIENVSLINVEGGGMIGVPGIASRVFLALARAGVNVIMISQASSEHSICLVCRASEAESAVRALAQELGREIQARSIQEPQLVQDLEIIAIIGEGMRGTPGISGRLFSALGGERINVLAIAQGSSERNISFVISRRDKLAALNVIHRAFLGGAVR